MRFKIDENLKRVAAVRGADPDTVAVELLAWLVEKGMIEDPTDYWGDTVIIATGPQYVSDICAVLAEYLYNDKLHSIVPDVFDAFCSLVIFGDGDCPYCGGRLEYVKTEGRELNDGDYFTPNSYVVDGYVYRCVECGKIIETTNDYD